MTIATAVVRPSPFYMKWSDLINHRPSAAMQTDLLKRFSPDSGQIHNIDDGSGDINLDKYMVFVSKLPTENGIVFTPEKLLDRMRQNINLFLDSSVANFQPYEPKFDVKSIRDMISWSSSKPEGTVISIDMGVLGGSVNPDSGSVVCSLHKPDRWIFTTLFTPEDNAHPVSGNREFGFYPAPSFVVFGSADTLWKSWQTMFAKFVSDNSGIARILPSFSVRKDWDEVKKACFAPTVPIVALPVPTP